MADAERTSVNVFFLTGVVALLAFVGLGLWYLFAPRAEVDEAAGNAPDRAEVADIANEEARDSLARELVLSRYDLERGPARISGTVVNNTGYPFVNVQLGFHLYDAQDNRVGTVRDTLPRLAADDTWNFDIGLEPSQNAARVEHYEIQGTPKESLGPEARSVQRPEASLEGARASDPD